MNRVRTKDYDGDIKKIDESLSQEDPKTKSNTQAEKVLANLSILTGLKYNRTQKIIDLLKKSERVSIDESKKLIVEKRHINISASSFLYDLQQLTKKLQNPEFFSKFWRP